MNYTRAKLISRFHSLAADRNSQAITIVLPGTDGDGALGLESVKAAGGNTFAQCEATAQFHVMPNTAIAQGHVDFILSPQEVSEKLGMFSCHPYGLSQLQPA